MTRFAFLLIFLVLITERAEESVAQELSLTQTTAALQRLGARVRKQKHTFDGTREVAMRNAICISDSWTGGDDGVKYVEQFFRDSAESSVVLYLFGSPKISDKRIAQLRDRNPSLRIREYPAPMLGVMMKPNENGVQVGGVFLGAPAETAGIKIGDVIFSLDGKDTPNSQTVKKLLRTMKIGQTITICVLREQQERTINATLGSYELVFTEPANQ
jgi:predicted metalloprotease with PDZ domain